MLTLVGVNPSWLVGWESSRVYEQTRQMIRVTCRCKRLRGGKHIVNGHFWTIIRVGSLVTVSRHTAWAKSRGEHAGGPLTRESVCRRGGGWSSVLRTLLGAADHCCRKRPSTCEDFSCLLCCWHSCLALSSQSLHTSLCCKLHSAVGFVTVRPHEAEESSSTYLHCLIEEPDCVSIYSFFCLVVHPW